MWRALAAGDGVSGKVSGKASNEASEDVGGRGRRGGGSLRRCAFDDASIAHKSLPDAYASPPPLSCMLRAGMIFWVCGVLSPLIVLNGKGLTSKMEMVGNGLARNKTFSQENVLCRE